MVRKKKESELPCCGVCAYFFLDGEDGECRRYPPVIVGLDEELIGLQSFPILVVADPPCGEFSRRLNS